MKKRNIFMGGILSFALLLAGCGSSGSDTFTAASAKNTDSKINVRLVKFLVEDQTDFKVKITEDLPASPQIFAGLDKDEFHFASLFSGEVYNNYFDEVEYTTDPVKTVEQAQKFFGEKHNVNWYDPLGYINNYSIAVKEDYATENHIRTLTDLGEKADELRLGTDNAWIERDNDGYQGFKKTYDYSFKDARGMDAALMYQGIDQGELDVVTAYTIDPQIIDFALKVLEDDKQFFPPYEASIVVKNEVLEEHPELGDILESLVGLISTEEMTELMHKADIEQQNLDDVAKEFLQAKGLLNE